MPWSRRIPASAIYSPGVSAEAGSRHDRMTGQQPLAIVSFPVEGMTCATCANRITRFLRQVDGVADASVNLATDAATVTYDPERTGTESLVAAVEAAGYAARMETSAVETAASGPGDAGEATYTERHAADLRRRLIVATVLTLPILAGLARMTIAPGLPAFLADP